MTVADLVGQTPLVRLHAFEPRAGVEIHAKLESKNPGGSVKDRAALAMIREGERAGALRPGRVLLDATSGNTGIAYAMLAAARGIDVRLCVPGNVTPERLRLLRAYGAELVLTDPMDGSDGAILEARRIYAEDPGAFFYPDQYSNPANWRAHYDTTGVEILEQTGGLVTHLVAGIGTSGTFVGVGRRLRDANPDVRLMSVQPDSPLHGLEGLKHMASAIVPAIYDATLADENLHVATEDAYELTRRLARDAGLFVGPSSGAALAAAVQVANRLAAGLVVVIFPDGGDRYVSERFWSAVPAAGSPQPAAGVHLPVDLDETIRAHARSTYPDECCGALLGRAPQVEDVLPIGNTFGAERRRRFLIGPDDYREAEHRAAASGLDVLGFYHSHPDHPAIPSRFDLDHAWPNVSYAIVSVRRGLDDELRSWRLRADRSGYDEESVRITSTRSVPCP